MELKTDKIHRILNTPYDELSPQDFDAAQEQLEHIRWREHAVTVENLETALTGTKAERDQFKGICERLERELEEANGALFDSMQVESKRAARIIELEREMCIVHDAHAKQVAGLEHTIGVLRLDVERKNAGLKQVTVDLTELEHASAQAANAAAMVAAVTAERDAAQQRELKALRQLADLVERTSKPTFYEYDALGDAARMRELAELSRAGGTLGVEAPSSAFAKLAAEETAAAHEAMDKREAEIDKYGYGGAPGTPPAKVVGLYDHQCRMPTPDGLCTARATGHNNGFRFCSRHLDAIRDGMRREHEQAAMSRVNAAIAAGKADPLAASIDGGQTWWCPQCQSSIIPDVPHVCTAVTCRRCGSSVLDGKDHGVGACPGDGMP